MLTDERREELQGALAWLTDPKRLPIDNVVIEEMLLVTLRALLELDAAALRNAVKG